MKIAIALTSSGKYAHVDTHGARAPYYLILNTDSGSSEILPNPMTQAERRAGPKQQHSLLAKVQTKSWQEILARSFVLSRKGTMLLVLKWQALQCKLLPS